MAWLAPESQDVVWFSGTDSVRFLNDLISQEISDMESGEARRALLLGPQGKLEFILWVISEDDRIGLVTDEGRGADLAATLGRYKIRVDVDITEESGGIWLVMGDWDGYDVSWPGVPRHLVLGDEPQLRIGSMQEYERARVSAGEPRWGVDVDDTTIPHSSGLVPTSVDFNKGCFLGQELVARIDSRGANVPRHLRIIEFHGAAVVGDTLSSGDQEVGVITSAANGLALAMVRRGVEVGDTVGVGGLTAIVKDLPIDTRG